MTEGVTMNPPKEEAAVADEEQASQGSVNVEKEEDASTSREEPKDAEAATSNGDNNGDCKNADEQAPTADGATALPVAPEEMRRDRDSGRHSSLELRKLPVSLLLTPDTMSEHSVEKEKESERPHRANLFRVFCLNPKLSLRTQLLLSFDSVTLIAITVVVLICVVVSLKTGENMKEMNSSTFSALAEQLHGRTARYLSESLHHRIIPSDTVQIIYEATMDRFQGFPNHETQVPFRNMDDNTNVYPIVGSPLPLDWQIEEVVTPETDEEHLQGRLDWYGGYPISAGNGGFIMQGACDPDEQNVSARTYWPDCTSLNNDITTGGVLRPSNLTETIHKGASDLMPIIKTLYEYNQDVREIGIYFRNQGVGATVNFPHYELDSQHTHTSIGCEWMKEPNPYDANRTIGTQEEIDQCYEEGRVLSAREYNPLSRAWCRNQALHPEKILVEGPLLDAWVDNNWLFSSGRAVYDRATKEFLACIFVGMKTDYVEEIMRQSRVTPNSEVSVFRYDTNGTVVASSAWNFLEEKEVVDIVELKVGMTKEAHTKFNNLVDYNAEWEPRLVQEAYENFVSRADGFVVAAHPIPPVPDEYDPTYRPVFFAMTSTAESDVFDKVEEVNEDVDERVGDAILFSVIFGAAGFVVATIIIIIAATSMTRPLQLMNKEADLIVGSFGDESDSSMQQIKPIPMKYARCVPNTEITDVVTEYNKMISSFSGSLMARSERGKYVEVQNMFDLQDSFDELYASRKSSDGMERSTGRASSAAGSGSTSLDGEAIASTVRSSHHFIHTGTNVEIKKQAPRRLVSSRDFGGETGKRRASPLFFWTVILFATPLLVTTITISAVVLSKMSNAFDDSVKDSELHYLDVSLQALSVYVGLRADFVSIYTSRSVRDNYLMTRLSSWIMFDGLERADSFTEAVTAVNECIQAESASTCPWAIENRNCSCSWNYPDEPCKDYSEVIARSMEIPHFFVSSDAALPNGTRLTTDFPNNSVSPSTTLWWGGPYELPGSGRNDSSSGYATTYDRMRAISALPLFPVLANYDISKENAIGRFISFEEDGLHFAYDGCFSSQHSWAAFWSSTVENGAAILRPELCPLGKYGYDPRCREWYDTGRKMAVQKGSSLYITAPYKFAGGLSTAQTVTTPLIDPRTGFYLGQVGTDFSVTSTFNILTSSSTPLSTGGFPLLVTIGTDTFGGDTVFGPGLNGSVSSLPVSQVVMQFDQDCAEDDTTCTNRKLQFETVVSSMKAGSSSMEKFERTTANGDTESVYMAFAPVVVHSLDPADVSDFSRGSLVGNHVTYSMGLVETEQGILEPFFEVQEDMQRQKNIAIGILAAVIFVAVVATIGISYLVARSISEPMAWLLELIRSLNRRDVGEEPPVVDHAKGSKEIISVSNTMESLYKVVRLANLSFYAGDLEAAYTVLVEALRLFRRLDNKKAIGVACNNLGNTMLAMYREMQADNIESKFGVTRQEIIIKGISCFQEAIKLGEEAYDRFFEAEGWSPKCLDFMQHLSNRYFNRAIFLLTIKNEHQHPEEIESLGFRDLEIARDMDGEIEAQGEENGWGSVNRTEKLFNVQLVRIRGHLLLLKMGYSDACEIDENLGDLFRMIRVESKKPHSDLFNEVSYYGRLQQAETEMMKHLLIKGEVVAAAKIAIRMLMEDECIFLDAKAQAVEVLKAYVDCNDSNMDERTREHVKNALNEVMDDLSDYDEARRLSVSSARSHNITCKSIRILDEVARGTTPTHHQTSLTDDSGRFVTMEDF